MTEEEPVSYEAVRPGASVVSSDGQEIGRLEHVLVVEDLDVFDGMVIATGAGLRFLDADHVGVITPGRVQATIDQAQAAQLPPPSGPPVYRVDALADTGGSLHDRVGRLFRRPHWTRE